MVPPVDQSKVVGSIVHAKAIRVMAEAECNILYGLRKKVNIVEGVVVNVDQKLLSKGRSNSMLLVSTKILMEVSRVTGCVLCLWLQDQF